MRKHPVPKVVCKNAGLKGCLKYGNPKNCDHFKPHWYSEDCIDGECINEDAVCGTTREYVYKTTNCVVHHPDKRKGKKE
jgi:hypothetical protein